MQKPRERLYFAGGMVCLILSGFLLFYGGMFHEVFSPTNDNYAHRYQNYYQSDIALNSNSLRQAAVYLPIYSITEEVDLQQFLENFNLEDAQIYNNEDYFKAELDGKILRVYKFLDLIEYEANGNNQHAHEIISKENATEIAKNFASNHFFMQQPFETKTTKNGDFFTITFTENLGKIPNKDFQSFVLIDFYGNITSAKHFYFEYEEIGRKDMLTPRQAAASLPQHNQPKKSITNYEIAYIFQNSVLQPAYIFQIRCQNNQQTSHAIPALKF